MAGLILVALSLAGAGCFGHQSTNRTEGVSKTEKNIQPVPVREPSPLPVLSINKPGLRSTTDLRQVRIQGTTNMPEVRLGSEKFTVSNGTFDIPLDLKEGRNLAAISSGNGIVTSTIHIIIDRHNRSLARKSK